ncbi:Probable V-type proton ATPase 116 kDa subunit a [Eumeta japonica]|uniref:V-type proton ATPase subunit a n=1 Tax=Eumeta variegata TaxID=151549 RepID=A0A4C1WJA9_EUMVA|nr:Probable V-type proton ATPase 116 kDa subunit a [Eumeta japonica]
MCSFVAGVILRERIPAFERMLWRACRGNVFLRQAEIESPLEDPSSSDQVYKSVFIIFFQGDQLKTRVKKICEGFRATLYPCPEAPADRREMAMGVMTRIEDLNTNPLTFNVIIVIQCCHITSACVATQADAFLHPVLTINAHIQPLTSNIGWIWASFDVRRHLPFYPAVSCDAFQIVLGQTQDHRHRVLVAAAKNIKNWFVKVRKIKAIYHTLNLFNLDVTQKCLIAECWVPALDLETIQLALRRGTERSGSSVPPILNRMETIEAPPTYNRTNKFTSAFQHLIYAYGVATYREVNPAPYTIITFPFLFAVMFGDLGHGAIMAAFGFWMCYKEKPLQAKKIDSEIWNIFFGGRYIIFLMGLFSMYTGLIYNDIFSKSLNIFGSSWRNNYNATTLTNNTLLQLNPDSKDYTQIPYPFGVDPVWQIGMDNFHYDKFLIEYFKRRISVYVEFVPQIIFLTLLFFYMVLLMFIKWTTYGSSGEDHFGSEDPDIIASSGYCAPSILITFINMVLFKDTTEEQLRLRPKCPTEMYRGQMALQKVLVVIALLCVPVMLLGKPYYVMKQQKKRESQTHQPIEGAAENGTAAGAPVPSGHHDDDVTEVFIHQAIHTIEYVLGSVSHTASYLRLWALSLAHAQLAEVAWNMLLRKGLMSTGYEGGIILWAVFAGWAAISVAILVLMEGLSAFLHTLRLHWVEFQSKFYHGDGYLFQPFSFEAILDSAGQGEE